MKEKIDFYVLTLFPKMIEEGMNTSIMGRARESGKVQLTTIDIRDFSQNKHKRVDDYPYGGGAGMVMEAAPVYQACEAVKHKIGNLKTKVIYLTPQGSLFHQEKAKELAKEENLIFLCGHYEGIDERALELVVTDYLSIGDYVLTGGELPALVVMDAVARLIPGVLQNENSAEFESFTDSLLEYPQYTRPENFLGKRVPEVLQSGHHKRIETFRREQSILRTFLRRPDLLAHALLTRKEEKFLKKIMWEKQEEDKMKKKLCEKWKEVFLDEKWDGIYFSPGRVNLIGEHTDYNGGHVFPCALTIGTYGVAKKRTDRMLRFYSINFEKEGVITASLDDLCYKKEYAWANYPMAVIWAMKEKGYVVEQGMDLLLYGTIPNSSGLSSSASLEILTGFILKDFYGFSFDGVENAKIGQFAENQFIGVHCGIMDQFSIAMGKKDSAIFLNTNTLHYEYLPLDLKENKIVIMNTNKKRGLGDSKYNERRAECEQALADLQKVIQISALGELSEEQFEECQSAIGSDICRKRAKHAIYENQRTILAAKALKENQLKLFGKYMIASHESLKKDYEVTGIELDTLVQEALKQKGVLGARMTGAGFGGCAVSIVKESEVDSFISKVGLAYQEKIGYSAEFYVVEVGEGPRKIE